MTTKKTEKTESKTEAKKTESNTDATAHLAELIKGIKVAMMTTVEKDGSLRSRPMWTQNKDFDGQLWFFTREHAPKVDEVERDQHTNLAYSDPSNDRFVSVSGTVKVVTDKEKIRELWDPSLKAWFPKGLEDPEIALLRVDVTKAEYWDTPNSRMVQLVGFVKAVLTGETIRVGDHAKVNLGKH